MGKYAAENGLASNPDSSHPERKWFLSGWEGPGYEAKNGPARVVRHFSRILDRKVPVTTARRLKSASDETAMARQSMQWIQPSISNNNQRNRVERTERKNRWCSSMDRRRPSLDTGCTVGVYGGRRYGTRRFSTSIDNDRVSI